MGINENLTGICYQLSKRKHYITSLLFRDNVTKQIHNQKTISKLQINKYVNEVTTEVN